MVQTSTMVTAEMNATWKQFLQRKVNSFIKWDLVRFFHDNPHTADTAENIAQVVGRDIHTIQRELDGLVNVGVLMLRSISGQGIYQLSDNDDIRRTIHEFVAACHDRDFRVKAINYVVNSMGADPSYDL